MGPYSWYLCSFLTFLSHHGRPLCCTSGRRRPTSCPGSMRPSEDMYSTSSPHSRYWKYPKTNPQLRLVRLKKTNKNQTNKTLWILLHQDLRDPLEKINESKKQEDQKEEALQSNTDRWYTLTHTQVIHTHLNAPSVYVSLPPLSFLRHISTNTHTSIFSPHSLLSFCFPIHSHPPQLCLHQTWGICQAHVYSEVSLCVCVAHVAGGGFRLTN